MRQQWEWIISFLHTCWGLILHTTVQDNVMTQQGVESQCLQASKNNDSFELLHGSLILILIPILSTPTVYVSEGLKTN